MQEKSSGSRAGKDLLIEEQQRINVIFTYACPDPFSQGSPAAHG